jgi:hypothetical protein
MKDYFPQNINPRIKVLCITGAARSGSTILANILGQYEGFFTVGETHQLWTADLIDQRLCGCGKKLTECEVWTKIFSIGFQGFNKVDFDHIQKARDQCSRTRSMVVSSIPIVRSRWKENKKIYLAAVERLYRSIQLSTGCNVIVDTSKLPSYSYLLHTSPFIEPYIVHLIRDPRATAYSWSRQKSVRTAKGMSHMPRHNSLHSVMEWDIQNATTEALKSWVFPKAMTILYEDFISHTDASIRSIIDFVGEPSPSSILAPAGRVNLGVTHTVVGNPNRFQIGNTTLKLDDEWKHKMSRSSKLFITLLAWPLLIRYHYSSNSLRDQ